MYVGECAPSPTRENYKNRNTKQIKDRKRKKKGEKDKKRRRIADVDLYNLGVASHPCINKTDIHF